MEHNLMLCDNCGENIDETLYACLDCGNCICDICASICKNCHEYFCEACYVDHKIDCE